MKATYTLITLIALFFVNCKSSEQVFKLDGRQSMILTGKGPGQDGAINPYSTQDAYAIVKNLGENIVVVRIQADGDILSMTEVAAATSKEVLLKKGHELYLDADDPTTASVVFKAKD